MSPHIWTTFISPPHYWPSNFPILLSHQCGQEFTYIGSSGAGIGESCLSARSWIHIKGGQQVINRLLFAFTGARLSVCQPYDPLGRGHFVALSVVRKQITTNAITHAGGRTG